MRTTKAFVLGVIAGTVAGWRWGRQIEAGVREKTRGVRAQAAEGIRIVERRTHQVLDGGEEALRRAETFLQDTKEQVSKALRAGQEAIDPAGHDGRS